MHVLKFLKKNFYPSLFFCASLLLSLSPIQSLQAEAHPQCRPQEAVKLGVRLETEFWNLVQEQKIRQFSEKLDPIFQGLKISGIYTRKQQIEGLTGATFKKFEILNPIARRCGDDLVISYNFVAKKSNLTSGPTISVWKKTNGEWKIISHSFVPFLD